MLDHILKTARTFEKMHGTPPDVIYINPFHYQELCKHYSRMIAENQDIRPGFRLVIIPGSMLTHPEAALLSATECSSRVA